MLLLFRLFISVAKIPRLLLECTRSGRWLLLLYSHGIIYILSAITSLNPSIYFLLIWMFLQYQVAIFLVTAVRPSSTTSDSKCPICLLHFSDRFHHCFLVNRCIAICNVHCFLSFTFYATIATLICFFVFINQFFYVTPISLYCLIPMGEFVCQNLTWKQSGLIMLTRSTLMSAGCAGAIGLHVAKEFYYDKSNNSRTIPREIVKILLPALSIIRHD
jgi:hypothetical protein